MKELKIYLWILFNNVHYFIIFLNRNSVQKKKNDFVIE
jgi:hypothetical protein